MPLEFSHHKRLREIHESQKKVLAPMSKNLSKACQRQDRDPRKNLLLRLVLSQIVSSSRVPPARECLKEKPPLLERVMKGVIFGDDGEDPR